MTTSSLEVGGLTVQVMRKEIKHLHVGVYPPDGHVRVTIPHSTPVEAVKLAVISRLAWIRRRQANFQRQERQSLREMVTGETHYVEGRRYRLSVVEVDESPTVRLRNRRTLELRVRPGMGCRERERVLHAWHRARLREQIPILVAKWQAILGVEVAEWRIKRMKTHWGTCTRLQRRIWINLELAKKPLACLEYVVVHEMAHLLEPHHGMRFRAHLNRLLPQWELHRDMLNAAPLGAVQTAV
jgi:predicted metal-dependent hydrolase